MKIVVFQVDKFNRFLLLPLLVIILAILIGTAGKKSLETFTVKKELPIYSVDMLEKKAAITFDCAWGAEDIPDILKTLKKENIHATFFIVGQWAEKYPQAVKSIAEEGHDIANHSYSHLKMSSLDRERLTSEITNCTKILEDISGKPVDLFRVPYGDYNNQVISRANELGYAPIQWSVDSLDWKPGIRQQEILDRVMKKLSPGAIILFHNDTPHTAKILPSMIQKLRGAGYDFLPVSEMIFSDRYYIDAEGKQKRKE